MKSVLHTSKAPAAIGPYSQAVAVPPGQRMFFFSGQIGIDPATGQVVGGGVEAETRQVLANIRALLEECNATPEDVVKTTIFLTDMNDFAKVNAIYGDFFSKNPPARSTVAVSGLPKGVKVEIEVTAILP